MSEQAQEPIQDQPIEPQQVISQPEAPPAPDSSLINNRVTRLFPNEEPEYPQDSNNALLEQMQNIQKLLGQKDQKAQQPDPTSQLGKKFEELERKHAELQEQYQARIQQQEWEEAAKETAQWVKSNQDHYPLVVAAGFENVVMHKIENMKNATGRLIGVDQAAQMVNQEISDLFERCAQAAGYVKRDKTTHARREEADIQTSTPDLDIEVPPNWDDMSDDEKWNYLNRENI